MEFQGPTIDPRPVTARELQAIIHAEREGLPFFAYRDGTGEQQIVRFPPERRELVVGRNPAADICIAWDDQVSALHGKLERLAGELAIADDGLSRNGSYVNGERVAGSRRLCDGDVLRFGRTLVRVHHPDRAARRATVVDQQQLVAAKLSEQQRKVLIALCRPLRAGAPFATPPSNQEIAAELYLSVPTVKLHLRTLFEKFGVADLPQNTKRLALVGRALQSGLLSDHDFAAPTRRP
ncbi:MAG: FHA domain-containing protein [Solirubrobacteraceae bacterium]